jgi:hypothetical protein
VNRAAFSATVHCLTGCAIAEILGLVIATAAGWSTVRSIAIAVGLPFVFGYAFTLVPCYVQASRYAAHSHSPWRLTPSRSP